MRLGIYSSITIAAMICAGAANAAPPQLKGQYTFTGMATCEYSGQPFAVSSDNTALVAVPNIVPPGTPNGVFSDTFSVEGVRTFNGDGTGHVIGRSVEIRNVTLQPRVTAGRFEGDFTYTIDDSGLLTIQLAPGTFKVTELNLDGSDSTVTWTLDNFTLVGMIGNNNTQITLATPLPQVETQTFLTGLTLVRQRVCARSRVLTLLQP